MRTVMAMVLSSNHSLVVVAARTTTSYIEGIREEIVHVLNTAARRIEPEVIHESNPKGTALLCSSLLIHFVQA